MAFLWFYLVAVALFPNSFMTYPRAIPGRKQLFETIYKTNKMQEHSNQHRPQKNLSINFAVAHEAAPAIGPYVQRSRGQAALPYPAIQRRLRTQDPHPTGQPDHQHISHGECGSLTPRVPARIDKLRLLVMFEF